jgi:hypothetical protein
MKNIILLFVFTLFAFVANSQTIVNALPVCHTSGNPNSITTLNSVEQKIECAIAKDTLTGVAYIYNSSLSVGSRWVAISTNAYQTLAVATNTTTLSNGGGSMTIAGGGINTVGTAGSTITITGTEVDAVITNEGSLTVAAGSGTTSVINSNTSGQTGVTLEASTGLAISESGNTITLANSAPDQTVTLAEAGGIDVTGTYPSFTITDNKVLPVYISNAAALTGGLVAGQKYKCTFGSTECTAGDVREVY